MDQAVVLKEWVLAASYREIIQRERKEGKTEAILARVYNLGELNTHSHLVSFRTPADHFVPFKQCENVIQIFPLPS